MVGRLLHSSFLKQKVARMNIRTEWQPIVCPACKGRDLSLREVRTVAVSYRQRPEGAPKSDLHRIVHQSEEGCLYEYDSRTAYLEDVQAQCNICGLKWMIPDCKRLKDYRPVEPPPGRPATRKIRAGDVVRDITGGMNDPDLMEKYDLTAKQLELLLQQMVDKGVLTQEQINERLNLAETAITKAFDETRRSIDELDYGDKPPQASTPAPAPPRAATAGGPGRSRQARINVNDFVADILTGMSDLELLAKHSLNPRQLQFVFQRLLDMSYVTVPELQDRAQITDTSITKSFIELYQSLKELED
jgi:uncharacterized protein (DUF433 family)